MMDIEYLIQVKSLHGLWEDWMSQRLMPNMSAAEMQHHDVYKRDWRIREVTSKTVSTTEKKGLENE